VNFIKTKKHEKGKIMKIIYVHHGNRELGNPPSQDDNITKLGKKDAKIVSELMLKSKKAGTNFKCIYSSPYFRCKKTAKIINKKLNLPIIMDDRLNEFDSKNETWIDLQTRVRECIKDIVYKFDKNDAVICVTSGVNVVAFISLANKQKPSESAAFIGISSCSPLIFNIDKDCF